MYTVNYIVPEDVAYSASGAEITNNTIPKIKFPQVFEVSWQLLNSTTKDTNGDFSDFYTKYADGIITASVAVDNNFNWKDTASLAVGLTSGTPVATITIKNFTPPDTDPARPCGKVDIGDQSFYYCAIQKSSDNYILTCADSSYAAASFNPSANYAVDQVLTIHEAPIIKSTDIDLTNKGNGLFLLTIPSNTPIYEALVEGNEKISDDCKIELTIYVDGVEDFVGRVPVECSSKMDYDGPDTIPPTNPDYTQLDSRYAKLLGSADFEITDATKGVILADRTTATRYRIFIDNGAIGIESL